MSNIDFSKGNITTRDGRPVEIITTEGRGIQPIMGYIADARNFSCWYSHGQYKQLGNYPSEADLIQAPTWKLPDPPPGKRWHREDWTQEMLPDGWRPLLMGEVRTAEDQILTHGNGPWGRPCGLGEETTSDIYPARTRRPLPPERKTVPLGPEDVPPGSAISTSSGQQSWWIVSWVGGHVETYHEIQGGMLTFERLMRDGFQILRPGETEWKPCCRTVEDKS